MGQFQIPAQLPYPLDGILYSSHATPPPHMPTGPQCPSLPKRPLLLASFPSPNNVLFFLDSITSYSFKQLPRQGSNLLRPECGPYIQFAPEIGFLWTPGAFFSVDPPPPPGFPLDRSTSFPPLHLPLRKPRYVFLFFVPPQALAHRPS